MIKILAVTKHHKILTDLKLEDLHNERILWYWVDFENSTDDEAKILDTFFNFHALAIEDCMHFLQRPKVDHFDNYNFFVFHSLNENELSAEELDVFLGGKYLVTFHKEPLDEIKIVWERLKANEGNLSKQVINVFHSIIDKIVDRYFPAVHEIEDKLDELDQNPKGRSLQGLIDEVFEIRGDLLELRRIINSMQDLLYRMINSDHLPFSKEKKVYFNDIYDHLNKLSEMVTSNREMTADMRDIYMSINSNRMNKIMMLLTVITTIFVPLTFIAGIYGMNFSNMPELGWKYGYFIVLGIMVVISIIMLIWFKRKGWLDFD